MLLPLSEKRRIGMLYAIIALVVLTFIVQIPPVKGYFGEIVIMKSILS